MRAIPLLRSHRGIVKFRSAQQPAYARNVAPALQELVHKALQERMTETISFIDEPLVTVVSNGNLPTTEPLSLTNDPTPIHIAQARKGIAGLKPENRLQNSIPLSQSQLFSVEEAEWLRKLERDLKVNFVDVYQEERIERIEVLPGTCRWIFDKQVFREFLSSSKNEVLFIEGGAGLGKSSLAKFLTSELSKWKIDANRITEDGEGGSDQLQLKSPTTIVVGYFTQEGRDNSPKVILAHILYQILQKSRETFRSAAVEMFSTFTQQRDLKFYWSLFTRVRRSLGIEIFCVIDGADECIRQQRPERQTAMDRKMVKFLHRLCSISEEEIPIGHKGITKVLLTTRPELEITAAAIEGQILKILNDDVTPSVNAVVSKAVSGLVGKREVSMKAQDDMVAQVIERCGPVFQKGVVAVSMLKELPSLDLNNMVAVKSALDKINFEKYDYVYARVLHRIHPKDRELAAKIIRIIYFAVPYLDLSMLQHALAVDKKNPTAEDLASLPSKDSLSHLINTSLSSLIGFKGGDTLGMEHQSISDFLRTMSHAQLQEYSCKDMKAGHLHLAMICIRYLLVWRHQSLSEDEIRIAKGDLTLAALKKSHFFDYASRKWTFHAREAEELIKPHFALVDQLMAHPMSKLKDPELVAGYISMVRSQKLQEDLPQEDVEIEVPNWIYFLSSHNLEHLLAIYLQPRTTKQDRRALRAFSWLFPRAKSSHDYDVGNKFGSTALHRACKNANLEISSLLLKAGARGSVIDNAGYSPFAIAVEEGHEAIAELLIKRRQAYEGGDTEGELTCLHYAAFNGMEGVMRTLLNSKDDPNCKNSDGWTPVHLAAQEGKLNCLEQLLKAGGLPTATNNKGITPLHCATNMGRLEIVRFLFQRYPDLHPSPRTLDGSEAPGSTPLNTAARKGQYILYNFLKEKENPPIPDNEGNLPLHSATTAGCMAIVSQYRDSANLNKKTSNMRSPLHLAALSGHKDIFVHVRKYLTEDEADNDGFLPIHLAAICGNTSIVELYLGSPNINAKSAGGSLPLHLAAQCGHLETFKWLRDNGSENIADLSGDLAIHGAARAGHTSIIREFENNSDVHLVSNSGWLPIHLAASNGHLETVKVLIDIGSHLDSPTKFTTESSNDSEVFPLTPLLLSVGGGHEELAMYLVERGASSDANINRWTRVNASCCEQRLKKAV